MAAEMARSVLRKQFNARLQVYEASGGVLVGITDSDARGCFVEQLVDSARRVAYPSILLARNMGNTVADPRTIAFDPLRAAIHNIKARNTEEAFWLVFLFVHFGKSLSSGWRLARDFYAGPDANSRWTWQRVSADPPRVDAWLADQADQWAADGVKRHFGNHRKYESIKAIGQVVTSYVAWVTRSGSHRQLVQAALEEGKSAGGAFDCLYRSMSDVHRFGRTARFDYLSMLAKLKLAPIRARSSYLSGATGPLTGARLLFAGSKNSSLSALELEALLVALGDSLGVGQQELEDAICNWQKDPTSYRHFHG